ncbi:MAG TPA: magnesium/cobalt transporter CorA [Chloroflexia bacterium]|nr:magnesium/cobalt transporter CorA [Chloroflexia bacterium]
MLRTLLRDESQQFRVVEDPSAISEIVTHKDRLLWLDLESPTAQEFALIQEEFGLHPLAIEDAMARHQRPKVDTYENFYLVIFYSVAVEEPGAGRIPGRRGLHGTDFLRATRSGHRAEDMLGPGTTEGEVSVPIVEREGDEDPDNNGADERIILRELTLFLGQNFLITVHDHPISELDEAAKRWTRNIENITHESARLQNLPGTRKLTPEEKANLTAQSASQADQDADPQHILDTQPIPVQDQDRPLMLVPTPDPGEEADDGKSHHEKDIGILLYSLLDTIVDNYFPVIDSIVDRIEVLEESIFERYSQKSIESIFTLKKDLLALRKVLAPERDVLNILTRRDIAIFDNHTMVYFQDVYDHVVRVTDSIDTYRDLLSSALDSFLSMQSNRLNITVQTLTSVSIMLMSIATVTGWYGMNFEAMPELRSTWGYPGVMVVVAILVLAEFTYFKRKGWL